MTDQNPVSKTAVRESGASLPPYVLMGLSALLGGISLALFGVYLFAGLPRLLHLGLSDLASLSINTLLCLLFFLQHSLMLRGRFRKWLSASSHPDYHGAIFSIFSGVFLGLLMLCWQKTPAIHFVLDGALFWLMRTLFLLSIVGFYVTSRSLKFFDPFGIRDISRSLIGKEARGAVFIVRGSYRWVRHPFYACFLLMIWTPVTLTTDRLLFNCLWTAWIIIGTMLEERDLIASFGDAYRDYQQQVPMLIPYKGFPPTLQQQ